MKRTVGSTLVAAALFFCVAAGATRAEATDLKPSAKKVVIFYRYGTALFETGPLPDPYSKEKDLFGFRAGYKCKVFALFWAYIARWKCEPVAIKGTTTYLDKTKATNPKLREIIEKLNAAIGKKYPPGAMKLNFWEKHGRIFIIIIILGLIAFAIFRAVKKG